MNLNENKPRRVLGNLSEPQTIEGLTRILRRDQHSGFDPDAALTDVMVEVETLVAAAVDIGFVVSVGTPSTPTEMLKAVADHSEVLDLHPEKVENLRDRMSGPKDNRLGRGEMFILSRAGLAALQA